MDNIVKPKVVYPIIVEGKYDKIKLDSILDARVFTTDGFGVFKDETKSALFRELSKKTPLIIATDPDGAGLVIRNYFNSILPRDRVFHVYVKRITGKEKRKTTASKEGFLGVEGMDANEIKRVFEPFFEGSDTPCKKGGEITKADLFALGLSGTDNAKVRREALMRELLLPEDISASAFLDALNLLYTKEELEEILR